MENSQFRGIDHIGWTVPDMEAATQFLDQAFGAQVLHNTPPKTAGPLGGPDIERLLGLPAGGQVMQIRLLRLLNGPSLELFEVANAPQQRPAGLADFGYTHLGLYVDDVAAASQRFEAAGGQLLSAPFGLPGVESGPGNDFVYGRPPWGPMVELLKYQTNVQYPDSHLTRWTPAAA